MNRVVLLLALAVAAAALALAGCGDDAGTSDATAVETSATTTAADTEAATTETDPGATDPPETTTDAVEPAQRATEIWLVHERFLRLGWRLVPESEGVARVAVESLLAEAGLTAIPPGTELLEIAVEGDRATVDLSGPLRTGQKGRLGAAQVVYTVTQFENVRSVEVLARGRPLAGELAGARTRREFEDLLAPVVVESPTGLEPVTSPLVVTGTANTFEANVQIEVLGETGERLASTFTTATCGNGCRGDFRKEVEVSVAQQTSGTLVVSEEDASGGEGRPAYRLEIPLLIQPAR